MVKYLVLVTFIALSFVSDFGSANVADSTVPEPFQRFDPSSTKTINSVSLIAVNRHKETFI